MHYNQALRLFKTLLREAGFEPETPDLELVWSVFKSFALEPVPCRREALLVETGNFYPGENLFHLTLVREFWVAEDSQEYCSQLECDFTCSPHQELPDEQRFLWSSDFENKEEFYRAVESLKSFKAALRHPVQSWQLDIVQGMD